MFRESKKKEMETECLIILVGGLHLKINFKIYLKDGVVVIMSFAQYYNTDLMCVWYCDQISAKKISLWMTSEM